MKSIEMIQTNTAWTTFRCFVATIGLVFEFLLCRFLHTVPLFHEVVEETITKKARLKMVKDNYWESLFGWQMFKECWKMKVMDLRKKVAEGTNVVDSNLITTDGKCLRLVDLVRIGRPLVLNFGSSS